MNMNNNQVWVGDDDNVPYSSMSPSSASNKPHSDEQQQPATINPQLSVHHKSLSDYCVTSSRYILSRFRRRYRAYRQHFRYASANRCCAGKLSKSMSVNRRGYESTLLAIFSKSQYLKTRQLILIKTLTFKMFTEI